MRGTCSRLRRVQRGCLGSRSSAGGRAPQSESGLVSDVGRACQRSDRLGGGGERARSSFSDVHIMDAFGPNVAACKPEWVVGILKPQG